jgi:integrase/recombinase XerC
MARRGLVDDDPAAGLGVPRGPKRLPVVLKPGQVDRLLAEPSRSTRRACATGRSWRLLYATGIRVGELCGLRLGDVDLAADTVLVSARAPRRRIVPFGEPARAALLDYLANGRAAHGAYPGKPVPRRPPRERRRLPRVGGESWPIRRRCSSIGGASR